MLWKLFVILQNNVYGLPQKEHWPWRSHLEKFQNFRIFETILVDFGLLGSKNPDFQIGFENPVFSTFFDKFFGPFHQCNKLTAFMVCK